MNERLVHAAAHGGGGFETLCGLRNEAVPPRMSVYYVDLTCIRCQSLFWDANVNKRRTSGSLLRSRATDGARARWRWHHHVCDAMADTGSQWRIHAIEAAGEIVTIELAMVGTDGRTYVARLPGEFIASDLLDAVRHAEGMTSPASPAAEPAPVRTDGLVHAAAHGGGGFETVCGLRNEAVPPRMSVNYVDLTCTRCQSMFWDVNNV